MGPTIKEGREDQKSEARRLLMLPLLCSHKDGGDCPSLYINKPGFGSLDGKNDRHTFNWDGKHLVGFTCFQMP